MGIAELIDTAFATLNAPTAAQAVISVENHDLEKMKSDIDSIKTEVVQTRAEKALETLREKNYEAYQKVLAAHPKPELGEQG